MISKEQCFGSRVDLLCTHPDPLDDPDMYLPQVLTWAENGTTIDFTDPASARFTPTRVNSTTSMLSFNVTEEDHRDRVIPCSCFLVRNNANRDRDESEAFVLDPPGEYTLFNSKQKGMIRLVYSSHVNTNFIGCILLAVLVHAHTYALVYVRTCKLCVILIQYLIPVSEYQQ